MSKRIDITIKGSDFTRVSESKITYKVGGEATTFEDIFAGYNIDENWFVKTIFESLDKKEEEIEKNIENIDDISNVSSIIDKQLINKYANDLWFGAIVGIVKFKAPIKLSQGDSEELFIFNVTLQIQSRFDKDSTKSLDKPYFLSTLLLKDYKDRLKENDVPMDDEALYDFLLLILFKRKLMDAIQKGLFRTYRRFERNDDKLKGSIDIARHIKLNAGKNNGKIAYSFRENTVDNFLNCLIIKAYKHLKDKYYNIVISNIDENTELKGVIDLITNQLSELNLSNSYLIVKNIKPIAHPYYQEYESLRTVCIRILRDEGITFFDGSDDDIQGILYYIPKLWEEYLEEEFRNRLKWDVKSQFNENKYFGVGDNRYFFTSKPDFMFKKDGKEFVILDAKFIPKWSGALDGWENKSEDKIDASVTNDINKCLRDMLVNNCVATGVIFPTNIAIDSIINEDENIEVEEDYSDKKIKHRISSNEGRTFLTIPIYVPYVNGDYNDWKKLFDEKIQKGMNALSSILLEKSEMIEKNIALDKDTV